MKKKTSKISRNTALLKAPAFFENSRRATVAGAAVLAVLAFVAFFPALSGGFIWDDDEAIEFNPLLYTVSGLWTIWSQPSRSSHYFPLSFSSFWIEYQFWGLNPFGYHLVNLLLHAANAVLLFFLLRRMGLAAAWPAAALFAVHPIQASSVCWVIERKNLLCAFFYIGAFTAWLRFETNRQRRWYGASLGLFLLAMLSKTIAVTFPAAMLLFAWWKTGRIEKRQILHTLPFFLLGGALALLSAGVHKALNPDYGLTLLDKCLLAPRALCFYAAKLCWPVNFMGVYPQWDINPAQLWQYAFPALVFGGLGAAWAWRRPLGRGPFAALAFYAVSLSPILGFIEYSVMEYSYVHDHHQYLASAGVFMLLAGALDSFFSRIAPRGGAFFMRGALWALCILSLTVLSWREARVYRDKETFFGRNLERNPNAWPAFGVKGWALMYRDAFPEAEEMFRRALELRSNGTNLWNLGVALFRQGKLDEALFYMNKALEIAPDDLRILAPAGRILAELERYDEAKDILERVLQRQPGNLEALNNLAVCLIQMGNETEAELILRRILRANPKRAAAHANLGVLLEKRGETREAIRYFNEALRLDPNNLAAREALERLAPAP